MQLPRLLALLLALALAAGGIAAFAAPPAAPAVAALYLVQLAAPPAGAPAPDASPAAAVARLRAVQAQQTRDLGAIRAALNATVAPRFRYSRAFNGFALDLTPAQARAVAALPQVRAVVADYEQQLHTDVGPPLVGAAQPDQRPALFLARLGFAPDGRPAPPENRGVFAYDAASRTLRLQLFAPALAAPPGGAALVGPGGAYVADLAPLAVPGARGAYVGDLSLPAAAEDALFAGALSVSIAGPAGELRGELRPARGDGVLVGVIDSGIDPTNPAFAAPAPDGHQFSNPFGPGVYRGVCSPDDADGRFDPSFPCNAKLVGAYTFPTTDESPDRQGRPSPRDNHGHGTHTAGIAAGNVLPSVLVGSAALGPLAGMAPHANLVVYDVCGTEPATNQQNALRCSTAAILAAIDQALADGVEVINYSIGGATRDPWASPDSDAFLVGVAGGVFVAASAGNSGPNPGTAGAPANAPWLVSVAAASHGRRFTNGLAGFSGGSGSARPSGTLAGRGFGAAFGPAPLRVASAVVDSEGRPNPGCAPFGPEVSFAGAIVVCQREGLERTAMAANAAAAGAGGVVLLNDSGSGANLNDDVYPLPAVQLGYGDGQALLAWAAGCGNCQARIAGTARLLDPAAADILAAFSARGPDGSVPDLLKPDLTAPGVAILAAGLDVNPSAPDYQLLSGTSMAAPHVAGAAALLRQIHPDWTPTEIRSALMLSAAGGVRRENGSTLGTPFERGAGRLDVGRAALAGLVLDETYAGFLAANPAAGGDPSALNLPALVSSRCAATCVFSRTLRNSLPITTTWSASASGGGPLALAVEPASFALGPGERRTVAVTARIGEATEGEQFFGAVTLREQAGLAPEASLPVAVRSARSTLPAALELTATAPRGEQGLDLRAWSLREGATTVYGLAPMLPERLELPQDPTGSNLSDPAAGGLYTRSLTLPAGTSRFRVALGDTLAADLDLFVYANGDGDGLLDAGELLCSSAGPTARERCEIVAPDLLAGLPAPQAIAVLVQNLQGSQPGNPGYRDSFTFSTGLLAPAAAGNLRADVPRAVAAGDPFRLNLAWSLAEPRPGDVYIGVVGIGSLPGSPGDRGAFPLTLTYRPVAVNLPLLRR